MNKCDCEICKGEGFLLNTRKLGRYTSAQVGIDIYIDCKGDLNVDACNEQSTGCKCYQDAVIKINYCPMCGKKLTEETK